MYKKPASFLTFFLLFFILQSSSISAHTTLGKISGSPPFFRVDDHELNPSNSFGTAHVPGPLAYLWPGSGVKTYLNNLNLPPGYQSPFETFESPTQLATCSYSPEGAILASTIDQDSVGDFIIAINFSQPKAFITPENLTPTFRFKNISIYIPAPIVDKNGELLQDGFEPFGRINWMEGDSSNIVTTLTDDYGRILVTKADMNDPFAPGWWLIRIEASGKGLEFTPEREWSEWYYIRINQIKAPSIAGKYLFKIFLGDIYPIKSQSSSSLISNAMPIENWPIVLVKGDQNPGIIYGTIKHGGKCDSKLYGLPIQLPGVVRAVGVTAEGRHVEARGYFNASAKGHFEIEGVAPGTYTIYASAAGYPEQKVAEGIKIEKAQSLNLDIYLNPGTQVSGTIFSKTPSGLTPWRTQLPISIAIYNSDNYLESNIECFSPLNLTHAPYTSYVKGNVIFGSSGLAAPNKPKLVAFPWEGPVSYYTYTSPSPFNDPFGVFNGVGPAQAWWVDPKGNLDSVTELGSGINFFRFQFGQEGFYGVPTKLSGMVPQVFATWIDGLKPGGYFIRAFVTGYIQSDVSGTFKDVYFYIDEDLSDISIQMDLFISSVINVTVHFHSTPGSIIDEAIGGPDPGRILITEVLSEDYSLSAFNFTYVPSTSSQISILINGIGMAGSMPYPDPRAGVKYSLFKYRGLRDYGLHPGSYMLRVYMRGYIQAESPALNLEDLDQPLRFSTSLSGEVYLSTHMYKGGGINVTVNSIDWQKPPIAIQWAWDKAPVSILVYDLASKSFSDAIYFWDSINHVWRLPIANSMYSTIPWLNWRLTFGSKASMLITNGSTILERIGPDLPLRFSPSPDKSLITNIFIQQLAHAGFLYSSMIYRDLSFKSTVAFYPGFYAITCWSYGYVQEGVRSIGDLGKEIVYVKMGSISDLNIKLIKGVEFDVTIVFRKEGVLTSLPYNMSMRLRIYDDNDMLVAAASTSLDAGAALSIGNAGFFADGKKISLSGGSTPPIPAGTQIVEYKRLAGLFSYSDPSLTEALRRLTRFSFDHGVWGNSIQPLGGSYNGNWKIVIELVNWYYSSKFYPPTPALLQGETHLTQLTFLLPYNHLGPFELKEPITIPNAMLGEEKSIIVGLDQRGYLNGLITFLNVYGESRVASWVLIEAKTENEIYSIFSWDGRFEMYLPAGTYTINIIEEGLRPESIVINVSEGSEIYYYFLLKPVEFNIPEFNLNRELIVLAFSTLIFMSFIKKLNKKKN
ncbi:carboxypeptidase regulatory-like domain-containing protein [Candidatus Bathyarchaeota archaeon]|nr:carboxypeptidase regulatory-like domain-containing protein [Candidatus Bathyarchaeota archaeon]